MNLDERARRAAAGVRAAVPPFPDIDRAMQLQPDQQRRPRGRAVAAAAATALIVVAVTLVAEHATRTSNSPTLHAPAPRGLILYGVWHPRLQQKSWFTVRADGTGVRDLKTVATCATWWPNGRKILITDDAHQSGTQPLRPATINADGTGLHQLNATRDPTLNLGCGQVSPDGGRIAIEGFNDRRRGVDGIYLVRAADGGGLVRLTQSSPGGSDGEPRFSPDGHSIVFLRMTPGVSPEGAGTLFVTTTSGAKPRRITPAGWAFVGYDWSPDGQWIVFQRPYGQLYVVHPDGSGLRHIPLTLPTGTGAQNPTWSPDGSSIAFSLEHNGTAGIYRVRADGSHLQRVTQHPVGDEQTPDWTP